MAAACSSTSKQQSEGGTTVGGGDHLSREFIDEVFASCDTLGNGFISIKKLKIVMRALGLEPRQDEVNKIAKRMLENSVARSVNEEAFTAEELAYELADRGKQTEAVDEIQSAFKLFDAENKGYITIGDLRRIAGELGENLAEDELKEMISIADGAKKGRVTPAEFRAIMKKISLY